MPDATRQTPTSAMAEAPVVRLTLTDAMAHERLHDREGDLLEQASQHVPDALGRAFAEGVAFAASELVAQLVERHGLRVRLELGGMAIEPGAEAP